MSDATNLIAPAQSSAAIAAQAREVGEIQAGMVVAMRHPRLEAECFSKIVEVCKRPKFAAAARFEYPRGGSMVSGPSVNFAREAARIWGNFRYGANVIDADEFNYTIEGWAYDLETNVRVSVQSRFRRLIFKRARAATKWEPAKPAGEYEPNEREALELVNRNGAKAVRNAILQLLPADLVDDAMVAVAETVVNGAGGADRGLQRRQLVHAFRSLHGIDQERLEARQGIPLDNWSAEDILELSGIFTAIKEGQADRSEFFPTEVTKDEKVEPGPGSEAQRQLDALAANLGKGTVEGEPKPEDKAAAELRHAKDKEKLADELAEAEAQEKLAAELKASISGKTDPELPASGKTDPELPALVLMKCRERRCNGEATIPADRDTWECPDCKTAQMVNH